MEWPRRIIDIGLNKASVLVAGSGRSGTTWIGGVIAEMTRSRSIFEPCVLDNTDQLALAKSPPAPRESWAYDHILYIPPDLGARSRYYQPIKKILCGRIRSDWCDMYTPSGIYHRRLIKAIRVNLVLSYLTRTWPNLKVVWVMRRARNVIASQLTMETKHHWIFGGDFKIVSETDISDRWLSERVAALRDATTLVEKLAHRWCIETIAPLRLGVHKHPNIRLVYYEDLVNDATAWEPISQLVVGKVWSGERFAKARHQQSATSRSRPLVDDTPGEREHELDLSPEDELVIDRVIRAYNIGEFLQSIPGLQSVVQ